MIVQFYDDDETTEVTFPDKEVGNIISVYFIIIIHMNDIYQHPHHTLFNS